MRFLLIAVIGVSYTLPAQAQAPSYDRKDFFSLCHNLSDYRELGDGHLAPSRSIALTPANEQAINGIFDTWDQNPGDDLEELAYILATARRETMGTWEPVREAPSCGTDETCRERAIGTLLASRAKASGRPTAANYAAASPNGQRYYGRGYIQLTGEANYRQADLKLQDGHRLETHPDDVMQVSIAQKILVRGMLEGWFGNHKPLSRWLGITPYDWYHARDNVNPGSPHKAIAAKYAQDILACLIPAGGHPGKEAP